MCQPLHHHGDNTCDEWRRCGPSQLLQFSSSSHRADISCISTHWSKTNFYSIHHSSCRSNSPRTWPHIYLSLSTLSKSCSTVRMLCVVCSRVPGCCCFFLQLWYSWYRHINNNIRNNKCQRTNQIILYFLFLICLPIDCWQLTCYFTVTVTIPAFDQRARSAKEIWVQLSAPRFQKANKRFKLSADVHDYADPPKVAFTFFDGTTVSTASSSYVASC